MSTSKVIFGFAIALIAMVAFMNWPRKTVVVVPQAEITVAEQAAVEIVPVAESVPVVASSIQPTSDDSQLPREVDRMTSLFQPCPPLPSIVETVTYSTRADWVTGRAAYLGDYASHYKTSKHFISRSLHGMGNYLSDVVSKGNRFNVLRDDKEVEFHLVLDLSRLKLWTYYYNVTDGERELLKCYPVCAGQLTERARSGSLTPLGVYSLGSEIAVYKEGAKGLYHGEQIEMVETFGKRWIPLGREIANCTAACKGLGIHGTPLKRHHETGELVEDRNCIGHYESGGCIRLLSEDIEELFAVVVSRPSYIHIVKDFSEAQLPGSEPVR